MFLTKSGRLEREQDVGGPKKVGRTECHAAIFEHFFHQSFDLQVHRPAVEGAHFCGRWGGVLPERREVPIILCKLTYHIRHKSCKFVSISTKSGQNLK